MNFEIIKREKTRLIIGENENELKKLNFKTKKVLIITDEICQKKFSNIIQEKTDFFCESKKVLVLKPKDKSFSSLEKTLFYLSENDFSREDAILAVGGGAVCDLASLASCLYMRGIKLCLIPTTFLAQIDAAFGGKNAVNLGRYKNMIGVFRQPDFIFCGVNFFSKKELLDGFGELVKYFFLKPDAFEKDKKAFFDKLQKSATSRKKCVETCLKIKADFVSADPFDSLGKREYLNLGHSAAHAFESASNGKISHGKAVLLGLKYELLLSQELFGKKPPQLDLFKEYESFIPKIKLPKMRFKYFLDAIRKDKKNRGEKNKFFAFSPYGEILKIKGVREKALEKIFRRISDEYSDNKRA